MTFLETQESSLEKKGERRLFCVPVEGFRAPTQRYYPLQPQSCRVDTLRELAKHSQKAYSLFQSDHKWKALGSRSLYWGSSLFTRAYWPMELRQEKFSFIPVETVIVRYKPAACTLLIYCHPTLTVSYFNIYWPEHRMIISLARNLAVTAVLVKHSSERKGGSMTTMSNWLASSREMSSGAR